MKRLQNTMMRVSEDLKTTFQRFPFTSLLVFAFAVITAFFLPMGAQKNELVTNKILPFCLLWGIGTFFAESKITAPGWKWFLKIVATGLIACGFVYLGNFKEGQLAGISAELIQYQLPRFYLAYGVIVLALGAYFNFRRSGLPFPEYSLQTVQNLAQFAIISLAFAIGIALVVSIFVYLILNNNQYELIFRVQALVLINVVGIGILTSLLNVQKEVAKFFTFIVTKVLLVLLTIAFAIIYLYIGKIVITQLMPSNEVFRILAGLFIIGLPIWTIAGYYPKDKLLIKIALWLPIVFIPFIFLQGYALGLRIAAYGMTPARYLGIVLMVFEVLYIALYLWKKREVGAALPLIAVLAFIAGMAPVLNAQDFSLQNQKGMLERYLTSDFDSLTPGEKVKLAGAYHYLLANPEGKTVVSGLDQQKITEITVSSAYSSITNPTGYYYQNYLLENLDVSGYNRVTIVSFYGLEKAERDDESEALDLNHVPLYSEDQKRVLTTIRITDLLKKMLQNSGGKPSVTLNLPEYVETEDGGRLYFRFISFQSDGEGDSPIHLNFEGLLLQP